MKKILLLLIGLATNNAMAADAWIHTGALVTGVHVKADSMVVYFKGGAGPCGGNGEYPFVIQKAVVMDQFQAMQSAILFAYASNKLVSVYGSTCEAVKSVRVYESSASFGNAGN